MLLTESDREPLTVRSSVAVPEAVGTAVAVAVGLRFVLLTVGIRVSEALSEAEAESVRVADGETERESEVEGDAVRSIVAEPLCETIAVADPDSDSLLEEDVDVEKVGGTLGEMDTDPLTF